MKKALLDKAREVENGRMINQVRTGERDDKGKERESESHRRNARIVNVDAKFDTIMDAK